MINLLMHGQYNLQVSEQISTSATSYFSTPIRALLCFLTPYIHPDLEFENKHDVASGIGSVLYGLVANLIYDAIFVIGLHNAEHPFLWK
jgi:hypothetical protein